MLPAAARRWVEDVAGTPLTHVLAMPGATSSDVFGLAFADGRELVLRLHTKAEWLAAEPDIAAREAIALQALDTSDVVAPSLVAVDVDGGFCGQPAVLMTRLRGHADLSDASANRLRALATALRPLHRLSAPSSLPAYRPYVRPDERAIPVWTTSPSAWRAAFEICDSPAPSGATALIHRDYHAGNVLVDDDVIGGIVDWPNACAGPPEIDVAHCRVNLAITHGPVVADAFAAEAATDWRRQAYWDVVDCVDLLDEELEATRAGRVVDPGATVSALAAMGATGLTPQLLRRRLDDYIAVAVRRFDGYLSPA
jgi:aminoglycoside phosphotransferase (APT) family kinase protein